MTLAQIVTVAAAALAFIGSPSGAAEAESNIVSLKGKQTHRKLAPFLGSYYTSSEKNDYLAGSVVIEDQQLHLAFVNEKGDLHKLLGLPLYALEQGPQHRTFRNGFETGTVDEEIRVEDSKIVISKVTESSTMGLYVNSRMVDKTILRIVDNQLEFLRTRNHYRRKYGLSNNWVVDESSHLQKINRLNTDIFFARTSEKPIPLSTLEEMARKIKQDLSAAEPKAQESSTAEIIDFQSYRSTAKSAIRCEPLLARKKLD